MLMYTERRLALSTLISSNTGGTTRPVKARSVSPTEETSRPVLTEGGPGDPSQAGITVAVGTRLALQWILVKGFRLYSFQLPDSKSPHMTTGRINQVAFINQGKTTSYSRKHMESGNRRRLDRHLLSGDKCALRDRISSGHRHNISATEISANSLFTFANNA
ncbi:LOW QUALITY PROTEIN: hypothetical protein YC2023_108350 [Brassica napus]